MRFVLLSGMVAGLWAATAGAGTLKAYRFEGGEYVAVKEMAEFYGLGRDASKDKEQADYRAAIGSVSVRADRRAIELNGVSHWLSAPVIFARNQLWMSATDVLKAVDPVLRSGRPAKPMAVRTIVLDPGHGGSETGTRGTRGVFEKVLTLDLALRLQRELQARGFQASLTRTSDRTLSLERRTDLAQARRADLFVSLHLNSGGTASGVETYALTPGGAVSTSTTFRGWGRNDDTDAGNRTDEQNTWLAHCVQDSLLRATGALDRGVRRARFMVLRTAPCPAVLVEAGFLSNAGEEKKLLEADYRDKLAKAMAEGIAKYRAGVERK